MTGTGLPAAARLDVGASAPVSPSAWTLIGTTSHLRCTPRAEQDELERRSPPLGRPTATRAALIPVRTSEDWWALTQDERRQLLQERSRHISTGLRYLPAVARRLYHSRHLNQPFDFLTWLDADTASAAFEDLVGTLRSSAEWTFVVREVDVWLVRT